MGNICRSPTVEAVARTHFARANLDIHMASAGTENYHQGGVADPRSIAIARARGYALGGHRARQVRHADFADFDHLLAMDQVNLATLVTRCPPQFSHKLELFLPFSGITHPHEVPDPYYGKTADFENVVDLAERGMSGLIERLRKASSAHV
ncbi:low molecular weight phosphotyrosine protein phosphatase [Pseudolysobacter antarcticus]|uniref:protein-tyrosine-phosphatase n=2 Tax=Pseudolysobacter antarcticus TaxID=2511995 RepID=A0A411HIV3_9GAMM|nr:low molecular weight phosphotyrosine protein phosphatase [Pseudolysobacter antarcticus]